MNLQNRNERKKAEFFYELSMINGINFASAHRFEDDILVFYNQTPWAVFSDSRTGSFTYLTGRVNNIPEYVMRKVSSILRRSSIRKYNRGNVPQLRIIDTLDRFDD